MSVLRTINALTQKCYRLEAEINQLEAERDRLRAALSVICNASQASARFDDLRQVAYEALKEKP